jgi:hypothetical protein
VEIKVKPTGSDWGPLELSVDLTEWLIDFIDNITVDYIRDPNCLQGLVDAVHDFQRISQDLEDDSYDALEVVRDEYEKLTGFQPEISKRYSTTGARILVQRLLNKIGEVE